MPKPTKILQYDLDITLSKVFDELAQLKAEMNQTSLFDLFTNIDVNMLSEDEARVVKDLMDGYTESKKLTIKRIKDIELLLQIALTDGQDGSEHFDYDKDYQNVEKHTIKDVDGKVLYTIDYKYADLAAGKLSYSEKKFTDQDGNAVSVKKTYTYDSNDNITDIVTRTTVTPPSPA